MKYASLLLVVLLAGCTAPVRKPDAAPAASASGAEAARAAPAPQGLTASRTAQGVLLSWSAGRDGRVAVWRGEESGEPKVLAVLPAGQSGFLDLSARRDKAYTYGVGDERAPQEKAVLPAQGARARIVPSLVTTCSGLVQGRAFPGNTQNYFTLGRDPHVQYFGYFIVKPYEPGERVVRLVWRDPAGQVFSEYTHSVTPRKAEMPGEPVGNMVITQAIGLKDSLPQNGQVRVPDQPGVYTVETQFDGETAAQTVFFIMQSGSAPSAPGGGAAR
jgi:hypothetical protein